MTTTEAIYEDHPSCGGMVSGIKASYISTLSEAVLKKGLAKVKRRLSRTLASLHDRIADDDSNELFDEIMWDVAGMEQEIDFIDAELARRKR